MGVLTWGRDRLGLTDDQVVAAVALVAVEVVVVATYLLVVPGTSFAPRFVLLVVVPFVWVDAALYAVVAVRADAARAASAATGRRRVLAAVVALGYFAVLAVVGGVVLPGIGDRALGWRLTLALPPGWSPALLYSGAAVNLNLIPYRVVGYGTLAYLVYVTVVDTARGAFAGVLGLFSCVSCALPVVAAVAASLLGGVVGVAGVATLASVASLQSYALSTAAFVVTVALLTWRPTAADLSRLWPSVRP